MGWAGRNPDNRCDREAVQPAYWKRISVIRNPLHLQVAGDHVSKLTSTSLTKFLSLLIGLISIANSAYFDFRISRHKVT